MILAALIVDLQCWGQHLAVTPLQPVGPRVRAVCVCASGAPDGALLVANGVFPRLKRSETNGPPTSLSRARSHPDVEQPSVKLRYADSEPPCASFLQCEESNRNTLGRPSTTKTSANMSGFESCRARLMG